MAADSGRGLPGMQLLPLLQQLVLGLLVRRILYAGIYGADLSTAGRFEGTYTLGASVGVDDVPPGLRHLVVLGDNCPLIE